MSKICVCDDSLADVTREKWKQKQGLVHIQSQCHIFGRVMILSMWRYSTPLEEEFFCPLHCTKLLSFGLSLPGNRKQSMFTLMMQITQHAVVTHSFSCSAQFHHIPFIPDVPLWLLSLYQVLLGTLWNNHPEKGKMQQTSSSSSPTQFPKFRLPVF